MTARIPAPRIRHRKQTPLQFPRDAAIQPLGHTSHHGAERLGTLSFLVALPCVRPAQRLRATWNSEQTGFVMRATCPFCTVGSACVLTAGIGATTVAVAQRAAPGVDQRVMWRGGSEQRNEAVMRQR